jgi:hypothetical protein
LRNGGWEGKKSQISPAFPSIAGLVPRQWSTGGKAKLLGISKRGNPYLRKMFIHGARAAVLRVKREGSTLGKWMSGLETRAARKRGDRGHRQQTGQDQLGSSGQRERLSLAQSGCLFQLDEVVFEIRFLEVCRRKERRKHSQTACLKTCDVTRSFTTAGISKDRHARIIIMRPETILH